MKAVIALIVLVGVVACWNSSGFHFPRPHIHSRPVQKNTTGWNSKGHLFPVRNTTRSRFVEQSGFFDNFTSAFDKIFNRNSTKKNLTWNSNGFRFVEVNTTVVAPVETPVAPVKRPSFFKRVHSFAKNVTKKIRHHAKKILKRLPFLKKAKKNTTEESQWGNSWNSAGTTFPQYPTYNYSNKTNNTWNSAGWRFEETAAPSKFAKFKNATKHWFRRAHHHVKKFINRLPFIKKAQTNTTEESAYTYTTYNSNGYTYPQPNYSTPSWNSQGYTFPQPNYTNTWNSNGYRFEETAAPSTFDKVKSWAKGLWSRRPWKKSD